MEERSTRYPVLLMLALCAAGFIPYLMALHGFFSNDDWVLLWHYGRMPLSQAWEFFSPRTIWFYRPLQSLQFGIFHQAFGLNSAPYNLALLAAHAACCVLVFQLLKRFTQRLGSPLLPWLATAAFSLQWIYLDMLLWKANFNTLQWAFVTLAACVCFSRYLDERSPRLLWATYALTFVNFFTKEQAVNLPVLLGLLWLFQPRENAENGEQEPITLKARLAEAVRLLAPVAALVLLYVAAHRLFIKDIYVQQKPGYFFVGPGQAAVQTLHIYNHALLSFLYGPLFQGPFLAAQRGVTATLGGAAWTLLAVAPVALAALAVRTRDRVLGLGLAWILASFLPCIFLKDYHASRFYYLPALGAALVTARLAEMAWNSAARLATQPQWACRGAVAAAVAVVLAANFQVTLTLIRADGQESDRVRAVFSTLQERRGKLAPAPLVVLRNAPRSYFGNGLGAREMAKFALGDPQAEAVVDGQDMEPARVAQLQAIPNVYLIDFNQAPLQVVQVKGERPTASVRR